MGIDEVAADLYALAPEEFTAARNARAAEAKADGDAALAAVVRGLRRPTVGAWLLNRLVRERGEEVEQVLDLGARLRAAQGTLGAADLRALDASRRQLTRAVAAQAVDIGRDKGRTVSAAVAAAVEETLRSAMVDPEAGAALSTGLLTDTFSASGLDPVDLSRAVAVGGGGPARESGSGRAKLASVESAERHERALVAARRSAAEAEAARRSAHEAAEDARNRAVAARRRHDELRADVEDARRRLAGLEERLPEVAEADHVARRAQLATTRDERSATEAAEKAARRLAELLEE
ncbi:hypothetical protein [Phycicoccus avicenniae]|uniref:hypothetical protein n=1 Tax=Phycicoccus avicenniae TaxID=2828860 RepID=UPI003D2E6CB1